MTFLRCPKPELLVIYDLARGRGIAAKLFSLPGTRFLGELSFSVFIWQNLVMILLWGSLFVIGPEAGEHHLVFATVGMLGLAMISTWLIEKPIARVLRKKIRANQSPT